MDFTNIAQISQGVERADATGEIDDIFSNLVDWEEVATLLRVEQWVGDDDGFLTPNNYRVYFEPGRPMVVVRWDTDGSFPISENDEAKEAAIGFDLAHWEEDGGSSLNRVCLADPDCQQMWETRKAEVEEILMDGRLRALGEQLYLLIEEGVQGDPRRECQEDDSDSAEAILKYLATGEVAEIDP